MRRRLVSSLIALASIIWPLLSGKEGKEEKRGAGREGGREGGGRGED